MAWWHGAQALLGAAANGAYTSSAIVQYQRTGYVNYVRKSAWSEGLEERKPWRPRKAVDRCHCA